MSEILKKDVVDGIDAIARAICQEDCAFRGEPACWDIDPDHWPPPTCCEPGCTALAAAAFFALPANPTGTDR